MNVECGYLCAKCGADESAVLVRERHRDEGIKTYVEHVVLEACAEHHRLHHGWCVNPESFSLKLPITVNGIGFAGDKLTPEEMEDVRRQLNNE